MTRSAHQIRISEAMKLHWKGRRQSKYGAVPTTVDGVRFASTAEAKRDAELVLLQRAGKITDLRRQPSYKMEVMGEHICTYRGDWFYFENGQRVVEDKKGVQTKEFKIKWALAKALYPEIEWRIT
jgi:hypothetical protein